MFDRIANIKLIIYFTYQLIHLIIADMGISGKDESGSWCYTYATINCL